MAAAVVAVVVEDILQRFGEAMKLGQQWSIKNEIGEIHALLSSIQEVLTEAENKYGRSWKLQEWVRGLKQAAFDAENLLEQFSVEEALRQPYWKVRRLFRFIESVTVQRRIRVELRDVVRRMRFLILPDRISFVRNIPAEIGETQEAVRSIPLLGRVDQKGELMNLLLGKPSQPLVIVYGRRGIGKTALIRELLSESELNRHFNVITWVDASPPFDEMRMARDIISSLTTKGGTTEEENVVKEQLLVRLAKLLDGRKKYLFILENLSFEGSDGHSWLRFCSFLEGGDTGSKIIVTTRHYEELSCKKSGFFLRHLTWEHSMNLLLQAAFRGEEEDKIDPAKLRMTEELTARCEGNPLFLQAAGHFLSLEHDTSDWSCFRGMDDYSFMCSVLDGGYPYGHSGPMVRMYNHLPPRMKQCFGLCSLFPIGHVIDRQTLAELWIALGFIKSSNDEGQTLDDIADSYFDQLYREGVFQVRKFDTFGKIKSVVLHPDAKDLAHSIAGWECMAERQHSRLDEALHISALDCADFSWDSYRYTGLRTVLRFVDHTRKHESLWNNYFPRLENVRVLDLHHMNVETVNQGVCKLKLLRYLDLSDNRRIQTLPPAITGLMNLQTLKLSGCSALRELPQDMRKMTSLGHLYIDGCPKLSFMPKGIGDLKGLSILTDFILPQDDFCSVEFTDLADLCKLNDLRGSLRIKNLGYSEGVSESFTMQGLLDKKSSLESLELIFGNRRTNSWLLDHLWPHPNLKGLRIHNYGGTLFPEWMAHPLTYLPNLVDVALIGCRYLKEHYFPQFGQLRCLKSLTIQGLHSIHCLESDPGLSAPDVDCNGHPFGELSSLCIRDCPKLECLPMLPRLAKLTLVNVNKQLFEHTIDASCLRTLRLENIELLDLLPEQWLRDPTSLEELHIGGCPRLNGLSTMIQSVVKMTLVNVSEELFWKPCRLPRLKTLRLENIELLHHLPGHWLRYLTSLKELHIGSCPSLVSLSRGMMRLKNLVSLSIWDCKELDLSKDEHGNTMMEQQVLKSLKFVTIYKASKLKYLPGWLSRVSTLRFLFIRSCPNLVALPEWIVYLRSLEVIELVHCPRLTSLPSQMYEFGSRQSLSIVGCPCLPSDCIMHYPRL